MGISGLLPMLKDISEELHIRSFAGQVAAIDAYCWIHKAAILCAEELILGTETSRYVESENECLSLIIWFCSYVVDLTEAEIELNVSNVFSRYVKLCMKYVDLLLANEVRPIMVFDGFSLDAKGDVESARKRCELEIKALFCLKNLPCSLVNLAFSYVFFNRKESRRVCSSRAGSLDTRRERKG